ncbi:MAG: D-alanyl-D-alanine carboxypeptidase [Clostridia bacterium]|nr:D-alanyl-D-alanine carboxypeptidase [Clostridia bacterium]MBQ6120517.1 D-alanyl-D-alanine carboxypeptidase [Clostridia bacterium]
MRKNILALLLSALLLCVPLTGRCQEIDLSPAPSPAPEAVALTPLSDAPLLEAPPIHPACAAMLLAEADSGQVIFQMNADSPRPVASVTKVMTILLALEALDAGRLTPQQVVTVSQAAAGMGGSQVLLDVNERQTVDTLLRCMIVGSANDAAVALAEAMYGSEALCVEAMNRRAAELGMAETHFENCTGLPAAGQHTTARDVAVMSRQVFAHPRYFDHSAVWMENIDHGDGRVTQLVNTNKLLRLCDGCDGGKTGSTKEAGYCVSATARRGDMRLVAVVLGAESGKERFAIAREMLEYGFANYRRYPVAVRGTKVRGQLPVTGGTAEGVALVLDGNLTLLIPRGDEQRVTLEPALPEALPAPVEKGRQVGHVRVLVDGRETARIPVAAAEDVAAKAAGLKRIIDRWVCNF